MSPNILNSIQGLLPKPLVPALQQVVVELELNVPESLTLDLGAHAGRGCLHQAHRLSFQGRCLMSP